MLPVTCGLQPTRAGKSNLMPYPRLNSSPINTTHFDWGACSKKRRKLKIHLSWNSDREVLKILGFSGILPMHEPISSFLHTKMSTMISIMIINANRPPFLPVSGRRLDCCIGRACPQHSIMKISNHHKCIQIRSKSQKNTQSIWNLKRLIAMNLKPNPSNKRQTILQKWAKIVLRCARLRFFRNPG